MSDEPDCEIESNIETNQVTPFSNESKSSVLNYKPKNVHTKTPVPKKLISKTKSTPIAGKSDDESSEAEHSKIKDISIDLEIDDSICFVREYKLKNNKTRVLGQRLPSARNKKKVCYKY